MANLSSELKPYYQDDGITLYNADCLEYIGLWAVADVLVTDPPYGMRYESGWGKHRHAQKINGDDSTALRDRVLQSWGDKPALVFGTWRVPKPFGVKQTGVWDKGDDPGMGDLSLPWGSSSEEFYVFGHGFVGKRGGNVLRFRKPPVANRDDHPTPKPVSLMESLLDHCPGNWCIADPFSGSGSTLVAARNLGRQAIGFEIEEKYCEIAARRLSQMAFDLGEVS